MNLGKTTNKKFIGRSVFVASVEYYGMPDNAKGLVGKIVGIGDQTAYSVLLPGHPTSPKNIWTIHPSDLRLLGSVLNN